VNCNVRTVRAESALARRLGDALAPLGLAARGDCFVLRRKPKHGASGV